MATMGIVKAIGPKGTAIVSGRRDVHYQWVVRFYGPDGTRNAANDYFTLDHNDALATARAMAGSSDNVS